MNKRTLSDTQVENLLELVDELQLKLKKKGEQLKTTRLRLGNAKRTIQRQRIAIAFQRQRILDLQLESAVIDPSA